jgi:hypothetical protein
VIIEIEAVNDAPTAQNDLNSQMEDSVESGWVSQNDDDVDNDVLVYTIVNGPNHGTLNWFDNGSYTYTPDENFFGEEQITYQVCDPSGECATATLTINVIFVNDIPQVEDETFSTVMDLLLEGSVALNDIELDPEILHYNLLTEAENGNFVLNDDGTFSYIPNDGFIGTEVIFYEGCDPCGACDPGQLTIQVLEVNTPPFAFDYSIDHCSLNTFTIDLLDITGDLESSDENLTWTIDNIDSGSWILEGSTLVYTPLYNQSSDVTISYTVCDNAISPLCASASIEISLSTAYEAQISSFVITDALCFDEENGSIDLTVLDEGYTLHFDWSNEASGPQIGNLGAGDYIVTITAEEQCSIPYNQTFTISQPEELVIDGLTAIDISDTPGGSSNYTISGGTEPYSFEWTNENEEIISEEMNLGELNDASQEGSYFLLVTDANGCSVEQQITITGVSDWTSFGQITLFPNPSSDFIVISAEGLPAGKYHCFITDATGRIVITSDLSSVLGRFNETIDLTNVAEGTYQFSLVNDEGFITKSFVKL